MEEREAAPAIATPAATESPSSSAATASPTASRKEHRSRSGSGSSSTSTRSHHHSRATSKVATSARVKGLEQRLDGFTEEFKAILGTLVETALAIKADDNGTRKIAEAKAKAKEAAERAIEGFFMKDAEAISEAARARDRAAHRQKLIAELVATEDEYTRDLWIIEEVWHAETARAEIFSQAELQTIFGTITQLISLSQELVGGLLKEKDLPVNQQRIGWVFRMRIPFFKIYIDFTARQAQALELIQAQAAKVKDLSDRLTASRPMLNNLGLNSWLIKPTQRITKYPLFLKDLLRDTDEKHPDFEDASKASEAMNQVLKTINLRTKERETSAFMINKVLPTLSWRTAPAYDLVSSRGRLLIEGKILATVTSKTDPDLQEKANQVVILDNLIMVCKVVKDQWQELYSFLPGNVVDLQSPDALTVAIGCTDRPEEVTIVAENKFEAKLWKDAIAEAIKVAAEAPALKPLGSTYSKESGSDKSPSFRTPTPGSGGNSSARRRKLIEPAVGERPQTAPGLPREEAAPASAPVVAQEPAFREGSPRMSEATRTAASGRAATRRSGLDGVLSLAEALAMTPPGPGEFEGDDGPVSPQVVMIGTPERRPPVRQEKRPSSAPRSPRETPDSSLGELWDAIDSQPKHHVVQPTHPAYDTFYKLPLPPKGAVQMLRSRSSSTSSTTAEAALVKKEALAQRVGGSPAATRRTSSRPGTPDRSRPAPAVAAGTTSLHGAATTPAVI